MKSIIVHGCYDQETFSTLKHLGIKKLGFDLRVRSAQFIKTRDLTMIMNQLQEEEAFFVFEDESLPVIESYLDIMKGFSSKITLELRDNKNFRFYQSLKRDFLWMFRADGDWRNILSCQNLKGVILPLEHKEFYHSSSELWTMIDELGLEVYLHSKNTSELLSYEVPEIFMSYDLGSDVETSYRSVNQQNLKNLKIWDLYAHPSR
jgi:hypothetical protein